MILLLFKRTMVVRVRFVKGKITILFEGLFNRILHVGARSEAICYLGVIRCTTNS
jgi:hypothetical protein